MKSMFIIYCIFLLLMGCSSAPKEYKYEQIVKKSEDSLQKEVPKEFRVSEEKFDKSIVQSGFLFSLSHINDRGIRGKFRVNWEGELYLPYKIKVIAKDKNLHQLITEVQNAYKRFFSSDAPKVKVTLLQRRYQVRVSGLVQKPGKYLVRYNSTMDEVLTLAGGVLPAEKQIHTSIAIEQTDGSKVEVPYSDYIQTGNSNFFPFWKGNDEIFIRKVGNQDQHNRRGVLVTGEVRSPAEVPYEKEEGIYFYLTKAGGFTNTSNLKKLEIQRGVGEHLKSIYFNMHELESIPVIYPGDRLIVHTQKTEFWEKVLDTMVEVATILTAVAFMIIAI